MKDRIVCFVQHWRVEIYQEDDAPDCVLAAALYDPADPRDRVVSKYLLPDPGCASDATQIGSLVTQASIFIMSVERSSQRQAHIAEMQKLAKPCRPGDLVCQLESGVRAHEDDLRMRALSIDHTGGNCMAYAIHGSGWWCWLTNVDAGITFDHGEEALVGLYNDDHDDHADMKEFKTVTEALDFIFSTDFDKWVEKHT